MTEQIPNPPKKVVLVEDHPLFRAMLAQLIDKELGLTVCGETDNIKDAAAIIDGMNPDIAIVDITLHGSSGLELIKDLKSRRIRLPVLVISMHDEKLYAERVLRAGARGYISKNEAASEVIDAIQKVLSGGIYVSGSVAGNILERLGTADRSTGPSGIDVLSDREIEVFQLIGHGLNSRQIAERIHLGVTTVDSYRTRIKDKLGIQNAAELYERATRWVAENEG